MLAEIFYGSYTRQVRMRLYFQPGVAFTMIGAASLHGYTAGVAFMTGPQLRLLEARSYYLCLQPESLWNILQALQSDRSLRALATSFRLPLFPIECHESDRDVHWTRPLLNMNRTAKPLSSSVHLAPLCGDLRPGLGPGRSIAPKARRSRSIEPCRPRASHRPPELRPRRRPRPLRPATREGILDPRSADLSHALPHGILFLDTTLDAEDRRDGLGHAAREAAARRLGRARPGDRRAIGPARLAGARLLQGRPRRCTRAGRSTGRSPRRRRPSSPG